MSVKDTVQEILEGKDIRETLAKAETSVTESAEFDYEIGDIAVDIIKPLVAKFMAKLKAKKAAVADSGEPRVSYAVLAMGGKNFGSNGEMISLEEVSDIQKELETEINEGLSLIGVSVDSYEELKKAAKARFTIIDFSGSQFQDDYLGNDGQTDLMKAAKKAGVSFNEALTTFQRISGMDTPDLEEITADLQDTYDEA